MTYQIKMRILALAVLTYAAIALAVSPDVFFDMVRSYFSQAMIIPAFGSFAVPIVALVTHPRAPLAFLLDILRNGGIRLLLVLCIFSTGMAAFTTLKLSIPDIVPFYADQFLADADAWLHGGNPGDYAHALIPDWAEYPLGYLYGPVWFMQWFALVAFVALQENAQLRVRYFWSMALSVCLLGTVAAAAFSSVGPIFYADFVDPIRFENLMASIKASAIGDYMAQASGYLLANFNSYDGGAGTGISAMPSMHLAIVTLNACMLTSLNRLFGLIAWVYVALIQLGSVFLGWHYALDGYFSIAVVSLIWWVIGRVSAHAPRIVSSQAEASAA